jgi:hypothetical protein
MSCLSALACFSFKRNRPKWLIIFASSNSPLPGVMSRRTLPSFTLQQTCQPSAYLRPMRTSERFTLCPKGAVGTLDNRIVFTGREEVKGYWDNLVFTNASPNSRLEYTEVRYGGGGTIYEGNIFVAYQDSLYVAYSTITDSATWGICADSEATLIEGTGNVYENNDLEDVNTSCD